MTSFADNVSTNGTLTAANAGCGDFIQSAIQYGDDLYREVRGNATWDVIKFLIIWSLKIVPLSLLLFVLALSLFSQYIHVLFFIKGRSNLFKLSSPVLLGKLVRKPSKRDYFRIKSRIDEITGKNDSSKGVNGSKGINEYGCVSLVMGPAETGKKLLVYAESDARYIISVPGEQWYDSDIANFPVKDILEKRAKLLVKRLLLKRPVCIVLEWCPTHELPSKDRMADILLKLSRIVADASFRKVSIVLVVPAYYQPQRLSRDKAKQKNYAVNLLNCTECRTLFDEKAKRAEDLIQCKQRLQDKAKDLGITLDRMIWVESFGRPKQVIEILDHEKYDSVEAWISLRDWWWQVYSEKEGRDDWLTYLYVLALYGQMGNGFVDAESILQKLFPGDEIRQKKLKDALLKICANHAPTSTKDTTGKPARFNPLDLDTLLIFDEPYVRERFILSLGVMEDGGSDIFNFVDRLRKFMPIAFGLKDPNVCKSLAETYFRLSGLSANLATQLSNQYGFSAKIKGMFGDGELVKAYERQMRDPVFMRAFVEKVISRLGALKVSHSTDLFKSINGTLRKWNSPSEYVRLAYELLPAYKIGCFLPHVWGLDFKIVIDEFDRTDVDEAVRFMCAALIGNAYEDIEGCDEYASASDIMDLFAVIKPAYQHMCEYASQNSDREYWRHLFAMQQVVDAGLGIPHLPNLDVGRLPQTVRTAWFAVLHSKLMYHAARINSNESQEFAASIIDVFDGMDPVGVDRLVARACKSLMHYQYDLNTDEGKQAMSGDIASLRQFLGRWSECPVIARCHFMSLCRDYSTICIERRAELLPQDALWDLLGRLREWKNGMCDCEYAIALASFAILFKDISENCEEVDLRNEWKDFAELVKAFWRPVLLDRGVESWVMAGEYFAMFCSLSRMETIPLDWRNELLREISINWRALCGFVSDPVSAVKWICDCNEDLFPPVAKLFWAAQIFSGKESELPSYDNDSMIAAAENLLNEARSDVTRKVDEALIDKLHEAIERAQSPRPHLDLPPIIEDADH